MTRWAEPPLARDQAVLFAWKLDEAIPQNHLVRLLDQVLGELKWDAWEASYHLNLGQPAIHPRVVAGVLIYGLLAGIRSSRRLEQALQLRIDFRWLAEERRIDHSTLSNFRRDHSEELKKLFVQVLLVAREEGRLKLERVGYDGTRVQANNRRTGTRTSEQLQQERNELEAQYQELAARAEAEEAAETEQFPLEAAADLVGRRERIQAALQEFEQLEAAGGTVPKRLPITDPEARVMPNKTGGSGVNYTPTTVVEIDSGLIVGADVLNVVNEDSHLIPALEQVQQDFGLEQPPDCLADGLMATGANLHACEQRKITLYSPVPLPDPQNPAPRADLTQPVPESEWARLPKNQIKRDGRSTTQLDKTAFVFDADRDCYWCPWGQPLPYKNTTSERSGTGRRIRDRYQADPAVCAACPLRNQCLSGEATFRSINREQYEGERERHAQRMAQPEAQAVYEQRRHPVETPFGVIKHQFGLRQFLLRGLERVRDEWRWACLAFNLRRLLTWRLEQGTGPPLPEPTC